MIDENPLVIAERLMDMLTKCWAIGLDEKVCEIIARDLNYYSDLAAVYQCGD